MFLEIGDLYRAIEHLDKAIELDGALDIAYCNRGLAHLELGDFEAAYEDFEKSAGVGPIRSDAL